MNGSGSDPARIDGLAFDGALAAAAKMEGWVDAAASSSTGPRIDDPVDRLRAAAAAAWKMEEGCEHVRVDVPYFAAAASSSSTSGRINYDLTFAGLGAGAAAKMVDVPYSDKAASSFTSIGPVPRHGDAVPFAATWLNPAAPAPPLVRPSMRSIAAFPEPTIFSSKLNPDAPSFEPTKLLLPPAATRRQATFVRSSSASAGNRFALISDDDDFLGRSARCFSQPLPSQPPSNSASPLAKAKPSTSVAPKTEATPPTLSVRSPVAGGRKTVLCRYWAKEGGCARGADCYFAHRADDMQTVDPRATYLNVHGSEGNYTDEASHAHGKYKTRLCWYWRPGHPTSCLLMGRCSFAHGDEELRSFR